MEYLDYFLATATLIVYIWIGVSMVQLWIEE